MWPSIWQTRHRVGATLVTAVQSLVWNSRHILEETNSKKKAKVSLMLSGDYSYMYFFIIFFFQSLCFPFFQVHKLTERRASLFSSGTTHVESLVKCFKICFCRASLMPFYSSVECLQWYFVIIEDIELYWELAFQRSICISIIQDGKRNATQTIQLQRLPLSAGWRQKKIKQAGRT